MKTYIFLLRGINVGGKNKLAMAELKSCLEERGFSTVRTYIASGNVILQSEKNEKSIKDEIEKIIPQKFKLDSELIKVLVLSQRTLAAIIAAKPKGFGEQPKKYHSDVIFLIDISVPKARLVFDPKEGVDSITKGKGVIYSQRLSAERTKSRLGKIIGTPAYKCMTIRSWSTVVKLLELSSI
jgi:uncharacterized protein (DUF1697 family)